MAKEKQRLRKKDLVDNIFLLLSKEFDLQDKIDDIRNIRIPVEKVSSFLSENYNLSYSSNNYIFSQIRSFEEENSLKLFEKIPDSTGKLNSLLLYTAVSTVSIRKNIFIPHQN